MNMPSKRSELEYQTPLGTVRGYIFNGGSLETLAELEVCHPELPPTMEIAECRIFKWHIKATEDCASFKIVCELDATSKIDGGPNSGEWLDAQTWESESHVLSIGTDDGDYLNFRAGKNLIPKRFMTTHPDGLLWTNYTDNGIEIEIPILLKGETIEARFSASWKQKGADKDDCATWYAIDLAIH